jgi:hypothetical protein
MHIPQRHLPIHGPFVVAFSEIGPSSSGAPRHTIPSQGGAVHPEQTPPPTVAFEDVSGRDGQDPGIAVSTSHVLICDQKSIAVYDKTGMLLPLSGPNPFSAANLFAKARADMSAHMNYPASLPVDFLNHSTPDYGDVRILFDSYRKRFWIYAQAKVSSPFGPDTILDQDVRVSLRSKAAVAVSKSENPSDGFLTYWWNETVHNGECNKPAGCDDPDFKVSGERSDYPSLGISPKYFVATAGVNRRDPQFTVSGDTTGNDTYQAWHACLTGFKDVTGKHFIWCGPFYVHVMVIDADALVNGHPVNHPPMAGSGRSFGLFVESSNHLTDRSESGEFFHDMARHVKPVVMHGFPPPIVPNADAYLLNAYIDRSNPLQPVSSIAMWSLVGDKLIPTLYRLKYQLLAADNDWPSGMIVNATYRNGFVHAVLHERPTNDAPDADYNVRLIRIDTVTKKAIDRERRFGGPNEFDDKPTDRFHLKFPAVEATANGNVIVVWVRFAKDASNRSQEIRFNAWYDDESDIRPSRQLHAGEAMGIKDPTDTAGIAVDPSDDETIWMAHTYLGKDAAGSARAKIAVGAVHAKKLA